MLKAIGGRQGGVCWQRGKKRFFSAARYWPVLMIPLRGFIIMSGKNKIYSNLSYNKITNLQLTPYCYNCFEILKLILNMKIKTLKKKIFLFFLFIGRIIYNNVIFFTSLSLLFFFTWWEISEKVQIGKMEKVTNIRTVGEGREMTNNNKRARNWTKT